MSRMLHDPIEKDPEVRRKIRAAEKEAELELADSPLQDCIGFCHVFWGTQQRILREKYKITWKSPAEMNPNILFD